MGKSRGITRFSCTQFTEAAFFGGKSENGFLNPKTDHESKVSTLEEDTWDQIKIRIFEIHHFSVFWEGI